MELTCAYCSTSFVKKPRGRIPKYCSPKCAEEAHHERRVADGRWAAMKARQRGPGSTCKGCGKKLRTGATRCRACHQGPKKEHPSCLICGTPTGHWKSTLCPTCRVTPKKVEPRPCQGCGKTMPRGIRCRQCRDAQAKARSLANRRFINGRCRECGEWFVCLVYPGPSGLPEVSYCSDRCGRKSRKAIRRAKEAGVVLTPGRRYAVYERDDWVCQLCGLEVDRAAQVPDLFAPTIDHIVPLAAGGAHCETNWQTAHFICNCYKRDQAA